MGLRRSFAGKRQLEFLKRHPPFFFGHKQPAQSIVRGKGGTAETRRRAQQLFGLFGVAFVGAGQTEQQRNASVAR